VVGSPGFARSNLLANGFLGFTASGVSQQSASTYRKGEWHRLEMIVHSAAGNWELLFDGASVAQAATQLPQLI
jgi:hypothetical protein